MVCKKVYINKFHLFNFECWLTKNYQITNIYRVTIFFFQLISQPFDAEEAEAEGGLEEEEIKEKSEEIDEMLEGEYEESEIKRLSPVYPPMPENPWRPPKETPVERPGQGANKYVLEF